MLALITSLLPLALQIVGFFVQNSKLSEEAKKRYFDFVKQAGEDMGSTKLAKYGDLQLQWLKDHPWKPGAN